jgi:hypothetical protein
MRRPFAGALTAAGGLLALVIGLAAIDERVRDQVTRVIQRGGPTEELTTMGARLQDLVAIGAQAVRDQSIEHAPLVIFALAAAVLVLFMLRT